MRQRRSRLTGLGSCFGPPVGNEFIGSAKAGRVWVISEQSLQSCDRRLSCTHDFPAPLGPEGHGDSGLEPEFFANAGRDNDPTLCAEGGFLSSLGGPLHVLRPPPAAGGQGYRRAIASMRRISRYSQMIVTMMPKAPVQPYLRGALFCTPRWMKSKSSTRE